MPFKSKAQQRFMFAAEERGDVPKGTAEEWAHKTKNIKKLPEHKKKASEIAEQVMRKVAVSPQLASRALSSATDRSVRTILGNSRAGLTQFLQNLSPDELLSIREMVATRAPRADALSGHSYLPAGGQKKASEIAQAVLQKAASKKDDELAPFVGAGAGAALGAPLGSMVGTIQAARTLPNISNAINLYRLGKINRAMLSAIGAGAKHTLLHAGKGAIMGAGLGAGAGALASHFSGKKKHTKKASEIAEQVMKKTARAPNPEEVEELLRDEPVSERIRKNLTSGALLGGLTGAFVGGQQYVPRDSFPLSQRISAYEEMQSLLQRRAKHIGGKALIGAGIGGIALAALPALFGAYRNRPVGGDR